MVEIELVHPLHAQSFHQPTASRVSFGGDGDDTRAGEIVPGPVKTRRRFLRVTLSPGIGAQRPIAILMQ